MKKYVTIFCCLFAFNEGYTVGSDIVHGRDVKLKKIPYQVSFQMSGIHFCGGSVINPYFVLTAAHYTKQFNASTLPFVYVAAVQEVKLRVVDQEQCKKDVDTNKRDHVYDTNICAFDGEIRKGQCEGDSGGPLTWDGTQVDLVSWSVKDLYCASIEVPGLFTRVLEYIDWIKQNSI